VTGAFKLEQAPKQALGGVTREVQQEHDRYLAQKRKPPLPVPLRDSGSGARCEAG
jgi:hypothetical protein